MPDEHSDLDTEVTIAIYQEVCKSYHAIDDFRAKLLGFLPLASGGIFLLLGDALLDPRKKILVEQYQGVIGTFGFLVTLGLFIYELRGIQRCGALIKLGRKLESSLGIVGQFRHRPSGVGLQLLPSFLGLRLSVTLAARIIYSTILAAWSFFGLLSNVLGLWVAIAIFLISFTTSELINSTMGKNLDALDRNQQ